MPAPYVSGEQRGITYYGGDNVDDESSGSSAPFGLPWWVLLAVGAIVLYVLFIKRRGAGTSTSQPLVTTTPDTGNTSTYGNLTSALDAIAQNEQAILNALQNPTATPPTSTPTANPGAPGGNPSPSPTPPPTQSVTQYAMATGVTGNVGYINGFQSATTSGPEQASIQIPNGTKLMATGPAVSGNNGLMYVPVMYNGQSIYVIQSEVTPNVPAPRVAAAANGPAVRTNTPATPPAPTSSVPQFHVGVGWNGGHP